MTNGIRKIVWTVDPFSKERDLQCSAAWTIKNLTEGFDSIIEPAIFLVLTLQANTSLKCQKTGFQTFAKKAFEKKGELVNEIAFQELLKKAA